MVDRMNNNEISTLTVLFDTLNTRLRNIDEALNESNRIQRAMEKTMVDSTYRLTRLEEWKDNYLKLENEKLQNEKSAQVEMRNLIRLLVIGAVSFILKELYSFARDV